MQELRELARDGELAAFIRDPPRHLRADNGVEGLALRYDPYLIDEASRWTDTQFYSGSLEYSTRMADLLARVLQRSLGRAAADRDFTANGLYEWWQRFSRRTYNAELKPVVIEITLGLDFPITRGKSDEDYRYYLSYRIEYRRSRGAYLQYAEPGGRMIPEDGAFKGKWGTLGGFVRDLDSGRTFAMTAQHVAQCDNVIGTPSFLVTNSLTVRSAIETLSSLLSSDPKLQHERGAVTHWSPPKEVDRYKCDKPCAPTNTGLDVALIEWPARAATEDLGVARLSQITPILGLEFRGARSGHQAIEAASLSIWHSYRLPGEDDRYACVGECLEIKHKVRPYVQTNVTAGGDSGAWVIARGQEKRFWIGSVLGGDGDRAGVAYANDIVDYFKRTEGLNLEPFF